MSYLVPRGVGGCVFFPSYVPEAKTSRLVPSTPLSQQYGDVVDFAGYCFYIKNCANGQRPTANGPFFERH